MDHMIFLLTLAFQVCINHVTNRCRPIYKLVKS